MKTNRKVTPISAASQPSKWKLRAAIGLALGVGLAAQGVNAATFTWDGGSGSNNFSAGNNWSLNAAPPTNSATNIFQFAGSTKLAPVNNLNTLLLQGIDFKLGAASFTLTDISPSNSITLGSSGITNNSASKQTVNNKLTLGAAQTFTNTLTGGTLAVGGTVNLQTNDLTLAGSNAIGLTGVISGTGALVKNGTGTTTLSGNNSYTGATNINAGTLALGANERLKDTGTVNVGGGTFNVNGKTETIANLNLNSGAINGGGTLKVATDYTNVSFGTGNAFDKSAGVTGTVINSSDSNANKQQRLSINGATAAYGNAAIDFGAKHVGDTVTAQTYNISNATTSGPALRGAVQNDGAVDARLGGSGIAAAGSDWTAAKNTSVGAKNVTFSTATSGALSETLTVVNNFNNTNTQTLAITGSVYDYAKVGFQNTGGAGTWDNTSLTLDFGSFTQAIGSQTATFSLANIGGLDAVYTDLLNGNYTFNLGSAFTSYNVSNFTDLAGGSSKTNLDFLFNTSTVGNYVGSIFLASTGHNISGYSGDLDGMTINFKGSVVSAVPVPAAAWLFLTGMVGLLGLGRRNKAI
ncbi:autotransporter-associated beta strand repeat-containing protein [Methylobacter psychrophilus]|uniref:autotransporter-associated beta strand repeat-containing protein n=1 Tax=Methylobacter psychrophilus TaxID=96941 RepID=UPI0021D4C556|nr:autotransporter-associated beta strand repeat-containing protein [Methylobacter psychrophilus]